MSAVPSWQGQAVQCLGGLSASSARVLEIVYLDALAAHLLGKDRPVPPYTIEHGSAIVSLLLRAVADAEVASADPALATVGGHEDSDQQTVAREAVAGGAARLAEQGARGAHRLVTRFLAAAVGELEQHRDHPEMQVRSLFYYGLMAVASGPENQASTETSAGILASFDAWDRHIGDGFVPPWRRASA